MTTSHKKIVVFLALTLAFSSIFYYLIISAGTLSRLPVVGLMWCPGISALITQLVFHRSLWPAAVLHASHNLFVQGVFTPLTRRDSLTPYFIDEFGIMLALATAAVAWAFWRRRKEVEDIPVSRAAQEMPTIVPDAGA